MSTGSKGRQSAATFYTRPKGIANVPDSMLEVGKLLPFRVLAERPAVVRVEDHQGVVGELQRVELVEHNAGLVVHPRDAGVVVLSPLLRRGVCRSRGGEKSEHTGG